MLCYDVNVNEYYCVIGNNIGVALLFIYKSIVFVIGCYFSFDLRNAPSDFKDREFLTVSISVLGVAAVILVPASLLLENANSKFLMLSLGINITTCLALSTYAIPKILHGLGILKIGEEMDNFLNRKNLVKCPTCKKPMSRTTATKTASVSSRTTNYASRNSTGSMGTLATQQTEVQ